MTDKSVLITGTSSGIGLETAAYLAERGFRVYATMRDLSRREGLDAEAARRNVQLEVLALDVRDRASIRSAVDTVIAETGGFYGLVNNAGIALRGYFEDLSDAEIRRVFETNVFGTMAVTRAVLPHMRTARQGRVVIITSVGGKMATEGLSAYCGSKFALEGFGESLALEMKPQGVHVVLVEPGITKSEIWRANRNVAQGAVVPSSPYYVRFRQTEQLADLLVESSPITYGQIAQVVHKALTTDRPKLRYLVGHRAKLFFTLRRYLPGELFDRLYRSLVSQRAYGGAETMGSSLRG
jgi:NAD(P)-dependent dehydrogenase (short-subunit alcohol dehydrogenase family)